MNVNSTDSSYTNASYSNKGVSGMMSGIDTESLVKSMLSGIQTKIDRKTQEQQQIEWKQEAYRDVIDKINSFQNKFFSLTSDTCIRSSSLFGSKSTESNSSAVSVSASSSAVVGERKIDVAQLATSTRIESAAVTSGVVTLGASTYDTSATVTLSVGDVSIDADLTGCTDDEAICNALNDALAAADLSGSFALEDGKLSFTGADELKIDGNATGLKKLGLSKAVTATKGEDETDYSLTTGKLNAEAAAATTATLSLTLDGIKKEFTVSTGGIDDAFIADVKKAFGSGVTFTQTADGYALSTGAGRSLSVGGSKDALNMVGLEESTSTTVNTTASINSLSFAGGVTLDAESYAFSINGTEFTFDGTESVSDLMNKINDSEAGVTMSYNSMSNTFTMVSNTTGAGYDIDIQDDSGLFSALGFNSGAVKTEGQNAIVAVDGVVTERSNNSFTFDGLTVTLHDVTGDYTVGTDASGKQTLTANGATNAATISTTSNTEKIYNTVVDFVNGYNDLIKELNDMIHEKATYKDYAPLTEDQEDEMSEKEIEKWNEKSKEGLLHNDADISSFLRDMRSALYSVYGEDMLANFGIDTSTDYKDYGKLSIDSTKLKSAIETDAESIRKLFVGEDGLGARLNEICNNTASTSSGSPGSLVQLAGVEGKATEKNNTLTKRLDSIEERIEVLKALYETRKERYWNQFNAMETALANINSTSMYLSGMISG